MSYIFRPAVSYSERHGCFVALVGGPSSGKTFSALRLARGIAGKSGKIAVLDTEAGRTLHLKNNFAFDVMVMDAPHRPERYAEAARAAEAAGYSVLVIDSFSQEWAGIGGILEWHAEELERMAGNDAAKRERVKGAAWIKPKSSHKLMVASLLQRRIPIIFAIRGEVTFKPPNEKFFKAICNSQFLFEVTVSFRLATEKKGFIDLSDPTSYKMEGAHRDVFRDGEQLAEKHGEALAAWAKGGSAPIAPTATPSATKIMLPPELREHAVAIMKALRGAEDSDAIDEILRVRADRIAEIKAASADAYSAIMREAGAASAEAAQ